jgi:hypothetical protein
MSPVQLVTLARGETIFLQPLKIKVNPEILKIRERLTEITAEKMAALLYLPKMNALQVCKRLKKERLDLEARMMNL